MKITKFRKKTKELYTISLDDNNTYDLYEEIILKYELLLVKNIDKENLDKILKDNKNYKSYYDALNILKKAIKTKKETENYLRRKEYSKDNIKFTIDILEKQGYLNDKNYAKSYVHNSILTTSKGPKKIAQELEKKGVEPSDYLLALKEYNSDIEKEKIEKLIIKKIKANHNKSSRKKKKKIQMDLINKGFYQNTIKDILNSIYIENNNEIERKEYQKYYNKLSKKYSGKELEYKLKQKMYSLGFNNYFDN